MPRSIGLSHIVRRDDGISEGVWGPYRLQSAYQPIFTFDDGKLHARSFEGLVRPSREGEAIAPGYFFKAIPAMDRLHVEALARNLHLLNALPSFGAAATIFINFDPSLFCERQVVESALREMRIVLHETGLMPDHIVCEVTEQSSTSAGSLQEFVDALRREGFRIAVDDYGAESSDMGRVKQLKPDIVKFDAQWISRLMDSRAGVALLQVMVEEFARQGILTVFEGIEEAWQLDLAEQAGAAMVQGFVLARPELAPTTFGAPAQRPIPAAVGTATPQTKPGTERPQLGTSRQTPHVFGRRRNGGMS